MEAANITAFASDVLQIEVIKVVLMAFEIQFEVIKKYTV